MSRGYTPRHAQNPLSGERRKTLSITHHALSPPPSHHYLYIISSISSIFCRCVTTCLGTRTLFFAGYPAILEYRVMNGLMFWPRLPWIRQNSFIIYHILISSITSRSTLMTFCKVNETSMSPANCSRYNQSLSDLLHQWNAEEMTLSYAGPELAMPISQTAIY